jgi:hypothetical protein
MRRTEKNTLHAYQRLEFNDTAIYVLPDYPDWFVPNQQTDQIIQELRQHPSRPAATQAICRNHPGLTAFQIDHFLARFDQNQASGYAGRASHRKLSQLKECWFHITNNDTYQALKPDAKTTRQVIYRGPHAALITDSGRVLYRGVTTSIDLDDSFDDSILVLDEQGNAINLSAASCCCVVSPLDDQAETDKACCE